jgi:ATP phosphoribosyltransferase regulatory subunit
MKNLKLHIVEGTGDLLFLECKFKKTVEHNIIENFSRFGYFEIETPTFEYDCVFSDAEDLYRMVDRSGEVLALRPDITTQIARIAATKLSDKLPIRASYLGNVYRYQDTQKGGRQNEFTQAGIELLGEMGDIFDAEVIAATISALLNVGLDEFMVELGDVNFVRGLLSDSNLDDDIIDEINILMTKKDTLSIEEILKNVNMNQSIKELFIKLPTLFGNIEIIDELLQKDFLNETSKNALENLKNILTVLSYYGYEKYISIDLGMNKNMDYYTGMIFKVFTHSVGFAIAGGGRYDKLISNFGKNISATGSAIYINRLTQALLTKTEPTEPKVDEIIKNNDIKKSIEQAQKSRANGKKVLIQSYK